VRKGEEQKPRPARLEEDGKQANRRHDQRAERRRRDGRRMVSRDKRREGDPKS
jgi:hypothetical protein